MKLRLATFAVSGAIVFSAQADQVTQSIQQALKDEGFYYGEVTGEKDADTTSAIRRYQIRNGLQITGEVNEETLKALGIDSSGARSVVKASPTTAPETSDSREEDRETTEPTNPLPGQPFPNQPQDRQLPQRRDNVAPEEPAEHFAGTPFEASPPEVQRNVIASAQKILGRQGLYRGVANGLAGPELDFSLRAYQARVRLPVTGRLDLRTLAALQLLPGAHTPIYRPRRHRDEPVRGEWIPER